MGDFINTLIDAPNPKATTAQQLHMYLYSTCHAQPQPISILAAHKTLATSTNSQIYLQMPKAKPQHNCQQHRHGIPCLAHYTELCTVYSRPAQYTYYIVDRLWFSYFMNTKYRNALALALTRKCYCRQKSNYCVTN